MSKKLVIDMKLGSTYLDHIYTDPKNEDASLCVGGLRDMFVLPKTEECRNLRLTISEDKFKGAYKMRYDEFGYTWFVGYREQDSYMYESLRRYLQLNDVVVGTAYWVRVEYK